MGVDASMLHLSKSLHKARDEPTSLLYAGKLIHEEVGASYLCSLAGPDGTASDELCLRRSVSRVVGRTAGELEVYVDRLAAWFEATSAVQFQLPVRLSELVVDFIRDEEDNWYMTQVKGFRLSSDSQEYVHQWHIRREELRTQQENEALAELGSDAHNSVRVPTASQPTRTASKSRPPLPASGAAMRQQLQEVGGVHCKLCGVSFTEGQMVRKKLSARKVLRSKGVV